MGFIMGVLIVSALLSIIFGKKIGALFATSVLGVAACAVSVCLVAIMYLYSQDPTRSNQASSNSSYSSYGSSSGTTPAYASSSGASPAYGSSQAQTYTPVAQTPTYQSSSPPPAPTGPRIGVDIADLPANAGPYIAYLNPPPGAGAWVRVHSGSPAEAAGLKTYDVILSAGTQTQPAAWITPSNQLPDILDRVGYNVPVRLHVYRKTGLNDFWVWVYPR